MVTVNFKQILPSSHQSVSFTLKNMSVPAIALIQLEAGNILCYLHSQKYRTDLQTIITVIYRVPINNKYIKGDRR